jgi:hypothetical protein
MLADRLRQAATVKGAAPGQQAYTTEGTYTFTVPAGVTSISAVCVGSGAAGQDSRAGMLCFSNNIATTPGESLTVVVGAGATPPFGTAQHSTISRGGTALIRALGGGLGGTPVGDFIGYGGLPRDTAGQFTRSGGGGAGGYTNNEGFQSGQNVLGGWGGGASGSSTAGLGGAAGGGGKGDYYYAFSFQEYIIEIWSASGGGGGVGILGLGTNGAAGADRNTGGTSGGGGGGGGSGGGNGISGGTGSTGNGGNGGEFGGAGGSGSYYIEQAWDPNEQTYVVVSTGVGNNGFGGVGAVRIIWGAGRSYPSNAANV